MKTTARTHIEVMCTCPNCNYILDIFDDDIVHEEFTRNGAPRAYNCDIEIKCEECEENFVVTNIEF